MREKINYYEVVSRLIGPIDPVGDSRVDEVRYENLNELTKLVECLLDEIQNVVIYKDRHEYSIKKAAELAEKFLDGIRTER